MLTPRRSVLAIVVAAVLVALTISAAAARPNARTPSRSTKIVKGIGAGHWSPTTVRISTGDSIKWKAVSNVHTVTAFGGNWSLNRTLSIGSPVTFRFTHAGTYHFRCRFHSTLVNGRCSGMCGKIVVA
jgi:plastocyanin